MKKRFFSLVLMLLLACTVFFTGCKEQGLKDNPATNATVFSNGGMSVIKGEYLYFVNGYVDYNSLGKYDNKAGNVTKSAIYRTKLNNGEIQKDIDGFLVEGTTERVVSKVVGFNNGGFTIIDDYIFYATPYMKLNSAGELQNNRVEFHKVKIDGTGDQTLYITSTYEDQLDWATYKIDNKYYLVVYENSKIVSVNAMSGDVVGVVENSTSYSFFEEETYKHGEPITSYSQKYIYFTRAITTNDGVNPSYYKGNAVCAFDIATGESVTLHCDRDNMYTIQHVSKDAIYYTYTNVSAVEACLYKRVMVGDWEDSAEIKLTNSAYDSYFFVEYGNDLILASSNDKLWKLQGGSQHVAEELASSKTVLAVYGEYAYFMDSNNLKRININTKTVEDAYSDTSSIILTNSNFIDFDNRRVYVYNSYTAENGDSNYYLNYFEDNFTSKSEFKQRFVGVFENDDIPAKPEQPEEPEYEGEEIEYVPHID